MSVLLSNGRRPGPGGPRSLLLLSNAYVSNTCSVEHTFVEHLYIERLYDV